jgi:large subunit ribosomal protein L35
MPKQKSHSGAKKRFKVTKSGKVIINGTDRGHFMTEKSQARKRKLRRGRVLAATQAKNIKRMINA